MHLKPESHKPDFRKNKFKRNIQKKSTSLPDSRPGPERCDPVVANDYVRDKVYSLVATNQVAMLLSPSAMLSNNGNVQHNNLQEEMVTINDIIILPNKLLKQYENLKEKENAMEKKSFETVKKLIGNASPAKEKSKGKLSVNILVHDDNTTKDKNIFSFCDQT